MDFGSSPKADNQKFPPPEKSVCNSCKIFDAQEEETDRSPSMFDLSLRRNGELTPQRLLCYIVQQFYSACGWMLGIKSLASERY